MKRIKIFLNWFVYNTTYPEYTGVTQDQLAEALIGLGPRRERDAA